MTKLYKNISIPLIGSWLNTGSSTVAELMSASGLDFVTIDMEHSQVSIECLANLLRAIKSGNRECKAIVRSPGHFYQDLKRYMDAGADGVIVPLVDEVDTVKTEEAILHAKFLTKQYGLFVGISSGANTLAAERWLKDNNKTNAVTILCDRGDRYLSCMD